MIKAIIFDYGGVLTVNADLRAFGRFYAPKFNKDPELFAELIVTTWQKAKVNKIDSGLFWQSLANYVGVKKEDVRKALMNYSGFKPDVLNLIKKLGKNYKLGLLSNQIEDWLEEVIKEHGLNKIFDLIVTSYGAKIAKPDISIFKEIIKKLNVNADECIYVDDMEKNIPPAKELGMRTILFKDVSQLRTELNKIGVAT